MKHAVNMPIKEFLSKKRQLPLGSKSEGGGVPVLSSSTCVLGIGIENKKINGDDIHEKKMTNWFLSTITHLIFRTSFIGN